jgi:TIR domain-containing protein
VRADVFVSYSQPDRPAAFEIVAQLEGRGIKVWVAPRDIAPSAEWAAEIIEAIGAVKIMVLVFSGASNSSPQVRREVERAVHRQVPILTVRVEDALPTKSMEYFLSAQHWLDAFPPPLTLHCEQLCREVSALLGAVPAPGAAPSAAPSAPRLSARPAFTDAELGLLQRRLAHHVGPVADYLVKRAAASASSWTELTAQLAAEIDAAPARQAFLEGCRARL